MKIINLRNKKFGRLTVVSRKKNNKFGHPRWKCKCDCGNIVIVMGYRLRSGGTKSCGCWKREFNRNRNNKQHPSWTGIGEIPGTIIGRIKDSSKKRGIRFNVSSQYIYNLFLKQKSKCAMSGIPLAFDTRSGFGDGNASLDRIDSSKGYVKNNLQWLHKDINIMKRHHSEKYFLELCQKITEYARNTKKI